MYWRKLMLETVHVDLPGRAYDVVIGPDCWQQADAMCAAC